MPKFFSPIDTEGIAGAIGATRYVGGTESGAPTTGTFEKGDFIIARDGKIWVCYSGGSPGGWDVPSKLQLSYYAGSDITSTAGTQGSDGEYVARADHTHKERAGTENTANKWAAGGYPGLHATAPGTRDGTKYLRDDGVWNTPTAPAPADATASTKGIVQLTGDLGGTAASPTVPGLAGKENTSNKGVAGGYQGIDATGGLILNQVASPVHVRGRLVYDTSNEALTFYNAETEFAMQIGYEHAVRVWNGTGATIANGQLVYINGTDATTGLPTVALAIANSEAAAMAIGMSTHAIETGTVGYVVQSGLVRTLNTSGLTAGAVVYLSQVTAGAWTTTMPTVGLRVRIGDVNQVNASTGSILVRPAVMTRLKRVTAAASAATHTPNVDTTDIYTTTLTSAATTIANPTGTPGDGQQLQYRFKQDATGNRTIAPSGWGTAYRFSTDVPAPTLTTTAGKTDYVGFQYNSTDAKYDCLAVNKGF